MRIPGAVNTQSLLSYSYRSDRLCLLQETNQEVPGWLQGMGARAPSFGGGKRRGGGGNRFGGSDFRRDTGNHCKQPASHLPMCLLV